MAVFFIIPAIVGALTVGTTAVTVEKNGKEAYHAVPKSSFTAAAPSFDSSIYKTISDCLTAASLAGAPLASCSSSDSVPIVGVAAEAQRAATLETTQLAAAPSFDAGSYGKVSDCLTAASRAGAELGACEASH